MFRPYFYKVPLIDKLKALKDKSAIKSEDFYDNEKAIGDKDYIEMVNSFYAFWHLRQGNYPLSYLNYISDSKRKERLYFNPSSKQWQLLDKPTR
jgi:hypothetical protein